MNKSRKEKEGEEYWVTHLMEKKTKKTDYAFSNCPARYIFRSSLAPLKSVQLQFCAKAPIQNNHG
jgi:hypothetical protein